MPRFNLSWEKWGPTAILVFTEASRLWLYFGCNPLPSMAMAKHEAHILSRRDPKLHHHLLLFHCCCSGVHIPSFSRLILKHPQNWKLALSESQYFVRVDQFGLGLKSLFREHVYFSGWFCVFRCFVSLQNTARSVETATLIQVQESGQAIAQQSLATFPQQKTTTFAQRTDLVGGWTNPIEKYYIVKLDHLPRDRGKNKIFELPPPSDDNMLATKDVLASWLVFKKDILKDSCRFWK